MARVFTGPLLPQELVSLDHMLDGPKTWVAHVEVSRSRGGVKVRPPYHLKGKSVLYYCFYEGMAIL